MLIDVVVNLNDIFKAFLYACGHYLLQIVCGYIYSLHTSLFCKDKLNNIRC